MNLTRFPLKSVLRLPTLRLAFLENVFFAMTFSFALIGRAFQITGRTLTRVEWILACAIVSTFISVISSAVLRRWPIRLPRSSMIASALFGGLWMSATFATFEGNLWIFGSQTGAIGTIALFIADGLVGAAFAVFISSNLRRVWQLDETKHTPTPFKRSALVLPLIGSVVMMSFVLQYTLRGHWVPFWDYGHYWSLSGDLSHSASLSGAVRDIGESVRLREYNLFPAALPAIVMSVFGDSWMSYVLTICGIYGTVTLVMHRWALDRVLPGPDSFARSLWPTLIAVTCPVLWGAMLRGYLDLGGVAFGLAALGLSLSRPMREVSLRSAVLLGICLAGMFLFRRWYSIWVVSFVAVAGAEWLITLIRNRGRAWWPQSRALIVAGVISAGLLLSFAAPMLLMVLKNNYSEAYTAYKLEGSSLDRLIAFFRTVGFLGPVAFTVAAIVGWCHSSTRRLTTYCVGIVVITHILFHRIQDLGPHHKLLYMPSYLMLLGGVGQRFVDRSRWFILIMGTIFAIGFFTTFEPAVESLRAMIAPIATDHPVYPVKRTDLNSLVTVITRVNDEAIARETTFVVVSSSTTFNQFVVQNFHRAQGLPKPDSWRWRMIPEVDKTGWFPEELFQTKVFLVAEPTQFHLPPHEQQIVAIAAEMLAAGVGLGAGCEALPDPVTIDNGVTLRLYIRTREHTEVEKQMFADRLKQAHPNWPRLERKVETK